MAAGDADAYFAARLSNDPDHSSMSGLATDDTKTANFWRGFRNCVEGASSSGYSTYRLQGYRAAQALGLFNVGA